jgi:hypothetical protein
MIKQIEKLKFLLSLFFFLILILILINIDSYFFHPKLKLDLYHLIDFLEI